MTKRLICLFVMAAMMLCMLAACGKEGPLTVDDAKAIVLEDLGVKESKVSSIDVHITTVDGAACYLVYISYDGENFEYAIDSFSGEILSVEETDSGHSH